MDKIIKLQLSECRTETETKCQRCRLEIAISKCTPPCPEGQTCVDGQCQGRIRATTFSRTQSTSSARTNQALESSYCPRGNAWTQTTAVDGNPCCRKVENKRKGGEVFLRGRKIDILG